MVDDCFKYNEKGRNKTGFDNWLDHVNYGSPDNPEYQAECQYVQEKEEFENWVHSNEIQGNFDEACKLVGINPKTSGWEELQEAYFLPKKQQKEQEEHNKFMEILEKSHKRIWHGYLHTHTGTIIVKPLCCEIEVNSSFVQKYIPPFELKRNDIHSSGEALLIANEFLTNNKR